MWFKRGQQAYRNGIINLILIIVIILALLFLSAWLGYGAGLNTAEGLATDESLIVANRQIKNGIETILTPISLAENADLQNISGIGVLDFEENKVLIDIILPEGEFLPTGSTLEAWLVDSGKSGGLGESSVNDADQQYGTPFANTDFNTNVENAPYALSLGKLEWAEARDSYHNFTYLQNSLTPYDAIMVTIESDGNQNNYDPRPGTPILIAEIKKLE